MDGKPGARAVSLVIEMPNDADAAARPSTGSGSAKELADANLEGRMKRGRRREGGPARGPRNLGGPGGGSGGGRGKGRGRDRFSYEDYRESGAAAREPRWVVCPFPMDGLHAPGTRPPRRTLL